MNEIKYIRTEKSEDGKDVNVYSYEFSITDGEIGNDTGEKYCGLSVYKSLMYLISDQFKWQLFKRAYNIDMEKPEDLHKFMTMVDPEYDTTLEELKENWDKSIDELI